MNIPHTVIKGTVSLRKADFDAMMERMEELEDIVAFDRALAANEEGFPADLVKRIIAGESAVRVFRKYRKMTQEALAAEAGVQKSMISKIESGAKEGSIDTIRSIARALSVDFEDLI